MIGRLLYGALFTVALPVLLALWARRLEPAITLPAVHEPAAGVVLVVLGLALMAAGIRALWVHGGGLPMNAFPPPRLVERGVYRFLSQPIYAGFVAACAGTSLAVGSRAGLWVVTQLAAAGCAALVLGYERHDLLRRFGTLPRPQIRLPSAGPGAPGAWERASVYLLLFLPWLVAYEAVGHIQPRDLAEASFGFERRRPVLPWTEAPYALAYPFVALAPLAAATRDVLRRFAIAGLVATVVGCLAYVALPLVAPPRPFDGAGPLAALLRPERSDGLNGCAACPSFHVAWTFLAAWVYARRWPRRGWAAWIAAAAIAAGYVAAGTHAVVDVAAGLALFGLALGAPGLWAWLLSATERVANSWREWRWGPARIINHGVYAGLGAALGVAGAGVLAGRENVGAVAMIALGALLGAGLWGQLLVGSPMLLRPFGYYGSILGAAAGLAVAAASGKDCWVIAAALAVLAPWVQLVGRFRCLVQGCCHGAPTGQGWGIRYERLESRVCRIGHLRGVPVHPTPLYSMLGNVAIGIVLGRLWHAGATLPLIAGLYLVLAGLARFVEESYRGEPQTSIVCGLRLYQWFALLSVVAGAVVMALRTTSRAPAADASWSAAVAAVLVGLAWWFAMGVDFPASTRRFSRLA
jgi:protein-S-isoprenylcysteine O-methyltransferase Ste14